ncbi:hypothetical protein [Ralstonia solanacearum]|uniref:hypothetical protein n=1 Tax=Ralstonia solanacearum TaxID=305 RepID=UPI000E58E6CE|nr:hypothetical protein [Ralstonia solanacearum]AXW22521.1 hypothetical protein CJO86_02355 [Ralstonia solanacearum]
MSAPTNTKKLATTSAPKVVVRRSAKRVIVTTAMKRQLRADARGATRTDFPELPEWQRKGR